MGELELFGRGALLGFAVSAPVGPIGVLCIQRTLAHGPRAGFAVGLGATAADACFAAVAAFGLTAFGGVLAPIEIPLRLVAIGVLGWMALHALRSGSGDVPTGQAGSVAGGFGAAFAILITNPAAIVVFSALFAGVGLVAPRSGIAAAGAMIGGVVAGAVVWWAFLALVTAAVRERLTPAVLRGANVLSAVMLVGFAVLVAVGR